MVTRLGLSMIFAVILQNLTVAQRSSSQNVTNTSGGNWHQIVYFYLKKLSIKKRSLLYSCWFHNIWRWWDEGGGQASEALLDRSWEYETKSCWRISIWGKPLFLSLFNNIFAYYNIWETESGIFYILLHLNNEKWGLIYVFTSGLADLH